MRSKTEVRRHSRATPKSNQAKRVRRPKPPGGKVLQRLFTFLGQRDPALNDDIVATVAVPNSVRLRYARTKRALGARSVTAKSAARPRPARRSAEHFCAASLAKAAVKLTGRKQPAARRRAGAKARAKAAPAALHVWQDIGPSLIPNGQTYG